MKLIFVKSIFMKLTRRVYLLVSIINTYRGESGLNCKRNAALIRLTQAMLQLVQLTILQTLLVARAKTCLKELFTMSI
jgi:hypothetical protein